VEAQIDAINAQRYLVAMKSKLLSNITPGEILNEEFLKPMDISQYRLAKDIGVPPRRINEIVKGQRAITADTALRLGRYFGMAAQFWLNLQSHYDLEQEQHRLAGRLETEVKVLAAA
jgi:addiction module HigA family antidote